MTEGTTADPTPHLLDLVRTWAPGQRWFPAKGTEVDLEHVTTVALPHPAGEDVAVRALLLRLASGSLLQVPLVLRPEGTTTTEGTKGTEGTGEPTGTVRPTAIIGTLPDGRIVLDGCHDPAFVEAWFAAATGPAAGHPDVELDVTGMRVLTGEQSNTSVLLPAARPPAILKVFRGVTAGPNPDVEVPSALSGTGWRGVPRPLAWLDATWPGTQNGHLGVLSELVTDAEDGFELACREAAEGRDLSDLAESLGRTTAQMHDALRRAIPVPDPTTPSARAERVLTTLRDRASAAIAAAPALADRADAVDAVLTAVLTSAELPPWQRVHGDYHLGQVLHSDARGWVVLDFEGEPQASAAERIRPDLALRDLAGMLRSLDYAAAVGGADHTWTATARAALVTGYLAEAGSTGSTGSAAATLLRALELDKALYEVVYETRNRPAWVHIPLDGVDRLLADTTR